MPNRRPRPPQARPRTPLRRPRPDSGPEPRRRSPGCGSRSPPSHLSSFRKAILKRNLELYPWYQASRNLLFWLPVFFLYFSSVLSLSEVLLLEAIYYLGVVLFEIPSGYFSDRIGRRITLIAAMAAWLLAGLVFATSHSFIPFAIAQVLLAMGMAFNSGTDSSLLYDSLDSMDRADEFGDRESRAQGRAFQALAIAALGGGLLAGFDLRIAYALSAVGALGAMTIALRFEEPPRPGGRIARDPLSQARVLLDHASQPALRWVFCLAVGMTVLNHVPYELFQPYLELLLTTEPGSYSPTPMVSGIAMAIMMQASAWVSPRVIGIRDRYGITMTLLGAVLLQICLIASLAAVLHPVVVVILLIRSVPGAIIRPITQAVIHPLLDSSMRATWLSVQSLAGRLCFSSSLALSSLWVGTAPMSHPLMRQICLAYVAAGVLMLIGLTIINPFSKRSGAPDKP